MGNVTQKVVGTAVQIRRPNGIDELVFVGEKETSRILRQGGQEFLGSFHVTNVVVRAVLEGNQHQAPRVDAVDRHLVSIGLIDGGAETPGVDGGHVADPELGQRGRPRPVQPTMQLAGPSLDDLRHPVVGIDGIPS